MSGIGAIYLFFFIGLLVSALMMAGSIPTLIYYGFDLISPQTFYLSAFILTSVIGVAIGSSLTTCATLGVAFIGMGTAFGANPAIIAGAVVSGAFFGNKMSPLSDTTSIAASIVGIDLFEHIRNMMYTTVPAWLITAAIFWLFSNHIGQADLAGVEAFRNQLSASGLIHLYALLPFVVLVVLAVRKVNAIYTIITTVVTALIVTFIHSSPSVGQLGGYFFGGYKPAEGLDLGEVGKLVSRGGINSMFFTQTIVILALSLGGLLNALGILPALMSGISHLLTSAGRATLTVAATSLGVNVLIGEQIFKPAAGRQHLQTGLRAFEPASAQYRPHGRRCRNGYQPSRALERVRCFYQQRAGCACNRLSALCVFLLFVPAADAGIRFLRADLKQGRQISRRLTMRNRGFQTA